MNKWFFEKNDYIINHPINITFDEALRMSPEEFKAWILQVRKEVVYAWDVLGLPPRPGYSEQEMIDQFRELWSYPTHDILEVDAHTGTKDLIRSTAYIGNAVNQFFPTMMKVWINYSDDITAGRSIYDYFTKDELFRTFLKYSIRHFKRDGFYNYSHNVEPNDKEHWGDLPLAETGMQWIEDFELQNYRKRGKFDYWIAPMKEEGDTEYSGFAAHLRNAERITINREELETVWHLIPDHCKSNVNYDKTELYRIRYFTPGQRIFPLGFASFRISYSQYAANFPPLIAKWLYETYTEPWKGEDTIYVWDPSAGWGGRLLGALSVRDDRHLTYLANDPNTDHNTTDGRTKYHEIYDFYCAHVQKGGIFQVPHNDFGFWQSGSEIMHTHPNFKRYKGKLSVVFTSPPYFAKERYSEDPTQSCVKYPVYAQWKEDFLKPTLETAATYLRPGGYLIWNIADAEFGGEFLPLEQDSCEIMQSLGLTFVQKYKMGLGMMPGSHRVNIETGLPKAKNFAKTKKGIWLKYEPIYIYKKS